jgi:hypothetical protein
MSPTKLWSPPDSAFWYDLENFPAPGEVVSYAVLRHKNGFYEPHYIRFGPLHVTEEWGCLFSETQEEEYLMVKRDLADLGEVIDVRHGVITGTVSNCSYLDCNEIQWRWVKKSGEKDFCVPMPPGPLCHGSNILHEPMSKRNWIKLMSEESQARHAETQIPTQLVGESPGMWVDLPAGREWLSGATMDDLRDAKGDSLPLLLDSTDDADALVKMFKDALTPEQIDRAVFGFSSELGILPEGAVAQPNLLFGETLHDHITNMDVLGSYPQAFQPIDPNRVPELEHQLVGLSLTATRADRKRQQLNQDQSDMLEWMMAFAIELRDVTDPAERKAIIAAYKTVGRKLKLFKVTRMSEYINYSWAMEESAEELPYGMFIAMRGINQQHLFCQALKDYEGWKWRYISVHPFHLG